MRKYFDAWAILLVSIVLLAGILRFWQLGHVPLGFHADEAAYGYNAYSLLLTGKDEYGRVYPLVLQSFGDYKPALYAYLTIPWVAIFDLTPFAVRTTAALFGLFSVIIFYMLTQRLWNNQKISLLAAFLLAISPWHLNLSRTVSEVVVALFFLLLLVYALHKVKEKISIIWIVVALLSGIGAIASYTAARFFIVLLITLCTLFIIKGSNQKHLFPIFSFMFCFFIAIAVFISVLDSTARFQQINILSTPETQLALQEQIREDQFSPVLLTRFFHNKFVNYSKTLTKNYSEYISPEFIFINGGYPYRVRIPTSGLFYFWQLPFLLFGIYILIRKKDVRSWFLLGWWMLLLFPAAFTFDEVPNVYRSLVVLPPMLIIIAVGVHAVLSLKIFHKRTFMTIVLLLMIGIGVWEFAYYQHQYYAHQEIHQPWHRGYPYKELSNEVSKLYAFYETFVITKSLSSPYIYLLFHNKYNPEKYQQLGSPRDIAFSGFDKYRFSDVDCPLHGGRTIKEKIVGESGILYVNKGTCPIPIYHVRLVKTIQWQDNSPAFHLLEYIPY